MTKKKSTVGRKKLADPEKKIQAIFYIRKKNISAFNKRALQLKAEVDPDKK